MKGKALVRWATMVAFVAAPLAALADNDPYKPKDQTSDQTSPDKDKPSDQTMKDKTKTAKPKLSDAEMQALAHFHHVNQTEIDLGKLAQKRGSKAAIKTYGQMLVKDHTANDHKLTSFAKKNNVVIQKETAITEDDQKQMKDSADAVDRLRAMKGSDFDRDFLQMMVQDHERELGKIDSAIGQVTNSDLVSILQDTKPEIQKHADAARDLQKANPQAAR